MLHELYDWTLDNCTITEMKARIGAIQLHMQQFELLFLLDVGSHSATTYWQLACTENRFFFPRGGCCGELYTWMLQCYHGGGFYLHDLKMEKDLLMEHGSPNQVLSLWSSGHVENVQNRLFWPVRLIYKWVFRNMNCDCQLLETASDFDTFRQ